MRILHVPYSFYPDPAGGTEVYVEALARCQLRAGFEAAVAAPAPAQAHYTHAGIPVWRFASEGRPTLREMYGEGEAGAAENFSEILDSFRPQLVHLHAMTGAVSVRLAEAAAARSIPVILNYHTPTVTCLRGTLMKWGSEICNGLLDQRLCAACMLHAHGLPRPLASLVASLPAPVSQLIGRAGLAGAPGTALRMPELVQLRIHSFGRMMEILDRVVALCNWTRDLLLLNGVPAAKIVLNRQGITWSGDAFPNTTPRSVRLPLRAAFLGRSDPAKGAYIMIEALKTNPELPIHLDLFGISQGASGDTYAANLQDLIAGDSRIRLHPPIPSAGVIDRLKDYDFLVVPSQCLETGPLVVLESFAARTPVVGSRLGGIAELVTQGVDGLLVGQFSSSAAWAATLQDISAAPKLLSTLRSGIRPPRHTSQAAADFLPLYEELLQSVKAF